MELIWSALTMTLAASKNFSTLIAIRFFVGKPHFMECAHLISHCGILGLAESTFYPAIQYVIGSWYKNEELAKRACIFHVRSPSATHNFI
jgi:ACS family pantothenate transporter-like MFS transporter